MRETSLVTGGSGFLGRHVVRALAGAGDDVAVLGRRTVSGARSLVADLEHADGDMLGGASFDAVYHVAGLAHTVPRTDAERERFHRVNVEGTEKLLRALDAAPTPPRSFVLVSTVAVYGAEAGSLLDEETPLRAADPYGLSKRRAEEVVAEWGSRRGVRVGIARLPLVAGPAAPGNLGAMVRGLRRGRYLGIGDGSARRSMVLARDVAAFLPTLAAEGGVFNLTDGHHPSFAEIEAALAASLHRRTPRRLPMWVATVAARAGDGVRWATGKEPPISTHRLTRMVSSLTFSDARARERLGWSPARVVDHAAELVA